MHPTSSLRACAPALQPHDTQQTCVAPCCLVRSLKLLCKCSLASHVGTNKNTSCKRLASARCFRACSKAASRPLYHPPLRTVFRQRITRLLSPRLAPLGGGSWTWVGVTGRSPISCPSLCRGVQARSSLILPRTQTRWRIW